MNPILYYLIGLEIRASLVLAIDYFYNNLGCVSF